MMQVTKVWWDGEKLMAEPIDPTTIYQEPAQHVPPQKWDQKLGHPWVGLSEDDIDGLIEATDLSGAYYYDDMYELARKIEAKLKERNA